MLRFKENKPRLQADMGWVRWKFHRLLLKFSWRWRRLYSPCGLDLHVKYLAEGGVNYVFRVQGERCLLRITKAQYYNLDCAMDSWTVGHNCELSHSLAEAGLVPDAKHLFGGAVLVDNAGIPVTQMDANGALIPELDRWFKEIAVWSQRTGMVLLDYNEGNWCWKDGRVWCVDVDSRFVCSLDSIREHPLVMRRIMGVVCGNDLQALNLFLAREKELLIEEINKKKRET